MSRFSNRTVRSSSLVLFAVSIWLPRAIGEDSTSQPATSQPSATSRASTSQPSDREIELREGRRIIEESAAVYKNCKSYLDEGEVVITYNFNPARPYTQRFPFKTAFSGPDRFRFEFTDNSSDIGTTIVWISKAEFRSWTHRSIERIQHRTRDDALQICLSLTDRRSNTILPLLFPQEFNGMQWKQVQNAHWIDQERSHGVVCDVLDVKNEEGQPVRIWIDVKTRLVRKIVMRRRYWGDQYAEFATTYKPQINVDIAADDLEFNAPKD